jgi:hypothetical protein
MCGEAEHQKLNRVFIFLILLINDFALLMKKLNTENF